jgi:hypothetical protein
MSSKVGHKINIQKLGDFLCTTNEQTEKDFKKVIPFIIASKKHKIPRNKFNKGSERPLQ